MTLLQEPWPPPFTLIKKKGVRYARIKTSLQKGLEFVVPLRFNLKNIPLLLEDNKHWIIEQLSRIHVERSLLQAAPVPDQIYLSAINEHWQVHYHATANKKLRLFERENMQLVLMGDTSQVVLCRTLLNKWLKKKAEKYLLPWLSKTGLQLSLPYSNAFIRGQKTRWGSCSHDKIIHLNYKLLLLPPEVVNNIIIHELCHTVHLNHSKQFWQLVAKFDANWKEHRKMAKKAELNLPLWLKDF